MTLKEERAASEEEQRQQTRREMQERDRLEGLIRERVLHDLGRPTALHCVDVRRLWGNNYRVNVFVGQNAASARVAHSYFLLAGDNGQILNATPSITRLYSRT